MLPGTQNKYIRSLSQQKYRKDYKVFLAEGDKIAREWLLSAHDVQMIVATGDWLAENRQLTERHPEAKVYPVAEHELQKLSTLQTAHKVLLVVPMPQQAPIPQNEWCIALQQIQDPGNMGTIIRIADWFGIKHIIASPDSVDFYNPKVVQSAMGAHLRVSLHVSEIQELINTSTLPVFAATLGGDSVYNIHPPEAGILLIGNESKGLPENLVAKATHRITIPRGGGAESLNAAVSAGILCAFLLKR